MPKQNIIIWDRFDYMLKDAGFTSVRFPGVGIEGLQTMDENGNNWRDKNGKHLSVNNFDQEVFYFVKGIIGKNIRGYKDDEFYLNQHVFNGEYSYFGKLITRKLTKIINLAAYKNTGNGEDTVTFKIKQYPAGWSTSYFSFSPTALTVTGFNRSAASFTSWERIHATSPRRSARATTFAFCSELVFTVPERS